MDAGLSQLVFFILGLGGLGVYLMLPRGPASEGRGVRALGGALATAALVLVAVNFGDRVASWTNSLAFYVMGGLSLVAAALTITSRNAVYSALWFALLLLSNSGLYLLVDAEFLAAATIIIYAGAIIVTFLFVIMLAQPKGLAPYDRHAREPFFACAAGVILAATLVGTLHHVVNKESQPTTGEKVVRALPRKALVQDAVRAESPTARVRPDVPHVKGLGETLFLEHYVSVELIGILLLVAVVGAVLIVGERKVTRSVSEGARSN